MTPPGSSARCTFCAAVSEGENPYDPRTQPAEHGVWHDAFQAVWRECQQPATDGSAGTALKEDLAVLPEQREFALLWRPFPHLFRLRTNDVIRINGRLGRVIRVTDCAAVVLLNQAAREFTTRFDKRVRLQPAPILIRISANAEEEILNRHRPRKRKRVERRPH